MNLAEVLVGAVLASTLLAAVMSLWTGAEKLSRASQSAALLNGALSLEEAVVQDIKQMGMDPGRRESFFISRDSLSFYRVRFAGDAVRLSPVRYQLFEHAPGVSYLARSEAGSRRVFRQAPLSQAWFGIVTEPISGNRYLRFDFTVRDPDAPPSRCNAHSLVLRIPVPGELGNPSLSLAGVVSCDGDLEH